MELCLLAFGVWDSIEIVILTWSSSTPIPLPLPQCFLPKQSIRIINDFDCWTSLCYIVNEVEGNIDEVCWLFHCYTYYNFLHYHMNQFEMKYLCEQTAKSSNTKVFISMDPCYMDFSSMVWEVWDTLFHENNSWIQITNYLITKMTYSNMIYFFSTVFWLHYLDRIHKLLHAIYLIHTSWIRWAVLQAKVIICNSSYVNVTKDTETFVVNCNHVNSSFQLTKK